MDDYRIIMLADDEHLTVKMDSVSVVGTDDYNLLNNIPKINDVEVKGNKALAEYDIESASEAKAQFSKLNGKIDKHASNSDIHVTLTDKSKWNRGTTYTVSEGNMIIGG